MQDAPVYGTILVLPFVFAGLLYALARARPSSKGTGRAQLVAGNLLVFLLGSSVVIAGLETYYRFIFDATDSFALTRTTQDWWNRHSKANSLVLRDNIEYTLKRTPGLPRVSFLGDSFTMAHGVPNVDDRFVNLIRRDRPAWEVHSLARNGYDTGAEIRFVQDMLRRGYQLDRVVLVYCLNDVSDIVPEWNAILARIKGETPGYLVQHSYLANILYYRLRAHRDPDASHYYHFVKDAYDGTVWADQRARLARLRNIIEANGGRLLVVTFPFLHALGPDYEYRAIHEKLDAFWKSQGVPHLDLLPVYAGLSPRQVTVNGFDAHPNEFAHRLAATAIEEFLDRQRP